VAEHDDESGASSERESTVLRASLSPDHSAPLSWTQAAESVACVLVADDDPVTRELIASTLRASGYEVETASDGQGAVERVARGGIDVVLLDAVMPRMSGVDACRAIRGLGETFVPILLAFAKTDPKSRIEALKNGADGYVCKPFEQTELLVCLAAALQTKRAHERLRIATETLDRLRRYDALTEAFSFAHLPERQDPDLQRP